MTPDRRTFLRLLLASAAAATFDVDRLLWVPRPMVTVQAMPWIGKAERLIPFDNTYRGWWEVQSFDRVLIRKAP